MTVKVGVNGFGRIGRLFYRWTLMRPGIEVVAVNDLTDAATLAHLLKYDSNYGVLEGSVSAQGNSIVVGSKKTIVLSEKDPGNLPWKDLGVDVVVEATGLFTDKSKAELHVTKGGAKRVVISAPAKNEDLTVVLGVNHQDYDPARHRVISNASCTTNCLAPVAKVLNDEFGLEKGLMNTVHAYTNDQRIMDLPHKDLRRARAAAMSIIPTTTGAAKAVSLVLPELKGKLNGMAMRVPVSTVSVVDLVAKLAKPATAEQVNDAMRRAANGPMKGILAVCEEPLVSIDFKGSRYSSVVDAASTMTIGDDMVKVVSWYDNEWAYAGRVADLIEYIASKGL